MISVEGIHDTKREQGYKALKLSLLDQITAPFMIIKLPFVYRMPLDKGRLIKALRNVLDKIPLIAGRVIKDADGDFSVILNGTCAS